MGRYTDYYHDFNMLYPDRMDSEQFERYVYAAEAYIDALTHNRAQKATGYKAERVRQAVCAVVVEMAAADAARGENGARLSSVSNDGYAESYAAGNALDEGKVLRSVAMRYLSGTGLVSFL